jgi:hypothetical protein
MAAMRFAKLELAGAGDCETLGRSAVGFNFRHLNLLLLGGVPDQAVAAA